MTWTATTIISDPRLEQLNYWGNLDILPFSLDAPIWHTSDVVAVSGSATSPATTQAAVSRLRVRRVGRDFFIAHEGVTSGIISKAALRSYFKTSEQAIGAKIAQAQGKDILQASESARPRVLAYADAQDSASFTQASNQFIIAYAGIDDTGIFTEDFNSSVAAVAQGHDKAIFNEVAGGGLQVTAQTQDPSFFREQIQARVRNKSYFTEQLRTSERVFYGILRLGYAEGDAYFDQSAVAGVVSRAYFGDYLLTDEARDVSRVRKRGEVNTDFITAESVTGRVHIYAALQDDLITYEDGSGSLRGHGWIQIPATQNIWTSQVI